MRCRRCQAPLPGEAAFCPECGLPVLAPPGGPQIAPTPVEPSPGSAWVPPATQPTWVSPAAQPIGATQPPVASTSPATTSPAPSRSRQGLLIAGSAVLVVVAGLVLTQLLPRFTNATRATPALGASPSVAEPASTPVTTDPTLPPTSWTPSVPIPDPVWTPQAEPTYGSDEEALLMLEARAAGDAASLSFEGQWVAQLASKYVGIRDPLQTAANGTHSFYASDILAESDALGARVEGARVVLLNSLAYGGRSDHDGEPFWVTMAVSEDFTSKDTVRSWCADQFAELSGDSLTNQCVPRQLNP